MFESRDFFPIHPSAPPRIAKKRFFFAKKIHLGVKSAVFRWRRQFATRSFLGWVTYSADPRISAEYYGFENPQASIDMLLNWGPIM